MVGRASFRKSIVQFAPLKGPRQHFHQHLRYGHEAVDRYRRGAGIAFAPLVVRAGIQLRLKEFHARPTFVRAGRVLRHKPWTPSFAETFKLVLLGYHVEFASFAQLGEVRAAGQSAPLVLPAMSGEMAADVLHAQPAY